MIIKKHIWILRINILKILEEETESKVHDYRDKDKEGNENYINEFLNKLPIHQLLNRIRWNVVGFWCC